MVAHREKAGTLMVRARKQEHLQILREWLTTQGVRASVRVEFPSDYPYRMEVSQVLYATWMYENVMNIDYHNVKGSVKDKPYHDAMMRVWGVMRSLTPRSVQARNDSAYDTKYPRYRDWWASRAGDRVVAIPAAGEMDPDWDDEPADRLEDMTDEGDGVTDLYGSIHDLTDEQVARLL